MVLTLPARSDLPRDAFVKVLAEKDLSLFALKSFWKALTLREIR